jgi:hypothetical protein
VLPTAVRVFALNGIAAANVFDYVVLWLGVSILMHSFPSSGDARSLYASVIKNNEVHLLVKILVIPVIGLIYIGAWGSIFWLDFAYAIGIAYLLPAFVIRLFY